MRVFVGIQLALELQEKILEWQLAYQQASPEDGMRWLSRKNLHITLLPPWYESNVEKVIATLQKSPPPVNLFAILFEQILSVPHKGPKYIWIEGKRPDAMIELREYIAITLEKGLEKREFRMHSTIARLKKEIAITPVQEEVNWHMQIASFALFQSHLSPLGAEYEVLQEFPLR